MGLIHQQVSNGRRRIVCALLALLALGSTGVMGQDQAEIEAFPRQTIRIIVPFAPGGTPDIVSRLLAQVASESFKRQVIVENRGIKLHASEPQKIWILEHRRVSQRIHPYV